MNDLARHLEKMLDSHRAWCRSAGIPLPPEVVTFVECVIGAQEQSSRDSGEDLLDTAPVPPLAHDLADAGRMLGISKSTVRRMIDSGALQVIPIGGRRVVARSELEALLARKRGSS